MKPLFSSALYVLLAVNIAAQSFPNPPNIVFILTDDLGWTDLSCYGNQFNDTPQIDKLAENGVMFTQAYAACPVCSPTRASIMTGKHPARLHLTNFLVGNRIDPESPVLPPPELENGVGCQRGYNGRIIENQRLCHCYGGEMAPGQP
jgi:hypothetical protein